MSASKSIVLLLSGLLFSCQEAVERPIAEKIPEEKRYFVSATGGEKTSHSTLQLLASGLGQPGLGALLKYDLQTYTITYATTYEGQPVKASGLMMVPVNMTSAAPMLSLQHGTTFVKDEAPSVRGGVQGTEFFASAGYITLVPDFLGYGESASLFHPYYDREHAASTVIDFIHAAREFLTTERISFNKQLFLAGYSEGGYVSLAAAREIENNAAHRMQVTAVAAGAGGYDLPEMLAEITRDDHYAYPSYLAFLLMAYNTTYDWNRPLTSFFENKYAAVLSQYMDGNHSGGFLNARLTTHVPALFNRDFYKQLKEEEGEAKLKKALALNSVAGWKTDVPIRLYHGTRDEIIPYENSQVALEKFKAVGSENVSLTLIPGGTHGNSFEPMLRDFIPWFLSM